MNIVVSVGNYGRPDRLQHFLSSIATTRGIHDATMIIVNSKQEDTRINELVHSYATSFKNIFKTDVGVNSPVPPGYQMLKRIEAAAPHANNETLYCNFDDDYVFHPQWLDFTKKIMLENPQVEYLSLLRPGTGKQYEIATLSGHDFIKVDSCMGGSFITRWPIFSHHMQQFFSLYGTNNNYDDCFWNIVNGKNRDQANIYMLDKQSLYQHCGLGSDYGHDINKMQGIIFDLDLQMEITEQTGSI